MNSVKKKKVNKWLLCNDLAHHMPSLKNTLKGCMNNNKYGCSLHLNLL